MNDRTKTKVEQIYPSTITYKCPKRGLVTEKIMVKKYASQAPSVEVPSEPEIEELLKLYEESRENPED